MFVCNLLPFCFQLTLTIVRQTGGLGISIAGGKGSTPYKGDDEVRAGEGLPVSGEALLWQRLVPEGAWPVLWLSRMQGEQAKPWTLRWGRQGWPKGKVLPPDSGF